MLPLLIFACVGLLALSALAYGEVSGHIAQATQTSEVATATEAWLAGMGQEAATLCSLACQ